MQRRTVLRSAGGLGLLTALGACVRQAPLLAPQDVAFVGDAPVSRRAEQIKRAGAGLGWIMEEQRPGLMRGTLNLRTHQAGVDIPYDRVRFSIRYMSSKDLGYREKKDGAGYRGAIIHTNYNGWVDNLEKRIVAESAV